MSIWFRVCWAISVTKSGFDQFFSRWEVEWVVHCLKFLDKKYNLLKTEESLKKAQKKLEQAEKIKSDLNFKRKTKYLN